MMMNLYGELAKIGKRKDGHGCLAEHNPEIRAKPAEAECVDGNIVMVMYVRQ